MKKQSLILGIFASLSIILMFNSCSKSPEQKAKELAGTEIKKFLYFPESYDPADIKIDSAFAPYDSPEFMELTANLAKTGDELAEAKEEIKRKRQSVSLWSMPFDSYSRNELNEAKAELAEAQAKEKKSYGRSKKINAQNENINGSETKIYRLQSHGVLSSQKQQRQHPYEQ